MSASRARIAAAFLLAAAGMSCKEKTEPLVPANVAAETPTNVSSTAGIPLSTPPAVRVTSSGGSAVPDVDVVFAVTGGGGTISSGIVTTNASGIATVGSWTLGTVAGPNTLTATVSGLTPVTFTATGVAGNAVKLGVTTPPSATAANRAVLAVQPVVQVQDVNSNAVSQANVTVTVTTSVGSVIGTASATTNASGVAAFSGIALAGTAGARTLSFSSASLTAATAQVTTTAGAAFSIAVNAGDGQAYFPNTAVPTAPSAKVSDQDGNGVAGTNVTFVVTGGGGTVSGATATSNSSGIATVGSWTLGAAEGPNSLSATVSGLSGSPVSFSATATNTPLQISSVSPATLTSGATATITGSGFSATAANNTVTIDGLAATVTAASGTSLTVTVPALACTPSHDGNVSVTTGGINVVKTHPIRAGTAHTLAVGGSVVLGTASSARCNELHNAATNAVYYVSVYNTNDNYSTTGASFELKGTAGAAAAIVPDATQSRRVAAVTGPRARRPLSQEEIQERNHLNFLERDLEILRQNAHRWSKGPRTASLVRGGGTGYAVGDAVQLRMRDISSQLGCSAFVEIAGRVAYVGTKGMIVEDNANPLAGTIDTTYAQIGSEFDTVMWPILEANYGNALVNDAVLDNNGKFVMVFTDKVRSLSNGSIAGFVTSCDLFSRQSFPSSNFGEYFYATSPTMSGDISCTGSAPGTQCISPPRWRWSMRSTIIHEVKHIVSIAERFSRNAGTFEVPWLEETTARLAEELYERQRYSFAQKTNIGYGSAANPVGPYCGVRLSCNQARGIIRVFEELGAKWYSAPHLYSPIGRIDSDDFSFYATGWSLVRWALDRSATAEATILKGLTQEANLTGVANFDAHMGTTFTDALPRWTLAMVVDDYPAATIADQAISFPSWNLRNVFAGYKNDFGADTPIAAWPLVPLTSTFGSFTQTASVRPGTSAIVQISGTQAAKQLLELKASGSSSAAPTELRMSIVRVQ